MTLIKELYVVEKGDIVSLYNRDYLVGRIFRLGTAVNLTGHYELIDGGERLWLVIRKRDQELVVLGKEIELSAEPPGETLDIKEDRFLRYCLTEGRAIGTSAMGYPRYVNLVFSDYRSVGSERYLFVQEGEEGRLAFSGEPVIASAVMVFPRPRV